MPKHQTAKHRKQRKKELANRMAKQLAAKQAQPDVTVAGPLDEVAEPMSPARRAYQNL